jgi:ferredoxin
MKARVDEDACIGCGLCASTCDAVFEMGDEKARVIAEPVPNEAEDSCREAAEACPVEAIRLYS